MTQPEQPSGQSPLIATPRSSLWRGVLATASAVATALIYQLARTLVVDAFGDNPAVKPYLQALLWLPVVIVAPAGAYVLYRSAGLMRERRRRAREADVLAGLTGPGPVAVEGDSEERQGIRPGVNAVVQQDGVHAVIRVLRTLPVRTYCRTGFMVMLGAMVEAPARIPASEAQQWNPPPGAPAVVLAELFTRGELQLDGPDGYRRTRDESDTMPDAPEAVVAAMRAAALPALLAHHADRASRWTIALDTVALGAAARRWFDREGPYLRTLVIECGAPTAPILPASAVHDLARIADALDAWYGQLGTDEDGPLPAAGLSLPNALLRIRGIENDAAAQELAAIRRGTDFGPQRKRARGRFRSSLAARKEHRRAQRLLRPAPAPAPAPGVSAAVARAGAVQRRLATAERSFESAWWLLPRADVKGEVCTLVNLAVVHIHQGRYDAAGDRLELAEALTRNGIDPAGRAHTHETMGVMMWAKKEPEAAARCWQAALRDYRALRDNPGIARCLQHLGSAAVAAPRRIGGLLLTGDDRLTTAEVLRQATGWLAEAERLGTTTGLARDYRAEAVGLLPDAITPLNAIDRWPLPEDGDT
ncbi:hypothetical protein [Nocardia sp. IFM 10818]